MVDGFGSRQPSIAGRSGSGLAYSCACTLVFGSFTSALQFWHELLGNSVGHKVFGISVGHKVLGISVGQKVLGTSVGHKVLGISVGHKILGISVSHKVLGSSVGRKALGISARHKILRISVGSCFAAKKMAILELHSSIAILLLITVVFSVVQCIQHQPPESYTLQKKKVKQKYAPIAETDLWKCGRGGTRAGAISRLGDSGRGYGRVLLQRYNGGDAQEWPAGQGL